MTQSDQKLGKLNIFYEAMLRVRSAILSSKWELVCHQFEEPGNQKSGRNIFVNTTL